MTPVIHGSRVAHPAAAASSHAPCRVPAARQQNQTPSDPTITTLFIGGVTEESGITEQDLRDFMYQFGEIRRVSMVTKQGAAFVEYADRFAAERAMASGESAKAMRAPPAGTGVRAMSAERGDS